ncbi:hypothetical protein [Streptococcus equinus]|uniref:hypothetical protein n=1 Tax=Streptococcus equinus TaxID=1335 RepID=UPI003BF8EABB
MNLFDDENKIIEHFQHIQDKEVFFPKLDDEIESLYKSIHESLEWKKCYRRVTLILF